MRSKLESSATKNKSKGIESVKKSLDQIKALMDEALRYCYKYGHSIMLERIAWDSLNLFMTKTYLLGSDLSASDLNSIIGCLGMCPFIQFFLIAIESSKNLNFTREFRRKLLLHGADSAQNVDFPDNLLDTVQKSIPKTWRVISMSLDKSNEALVISSIGDAEPMLIRLPLNRHDEINLSYSDALNEFLSIMNESRSSTKSKEVFERDEKQQWWTKRRELDQQLGSLLKSIEELWIGGFKGTLFPTCRPKTASLVRIIESWVSCRKFKRSKKTKVDQNLPALPESFLSGLLSNVKLTEEEIADAAQFIVDFYRMNQVAVEYNDLELYEVLALFYSHLYINLVARRKHSGATPGGRITLQRRMLRTNHSHFGQTFASLSVGVSSDV